MGICAACPRLLLNLSGAAYVIPRCQSRRMICHETCYPEQPVDLNNLNNPACNWLP